MKQQRLITRRRAIIAGLTSLSGMLLPACSQPLPPTYGNILRMGDVFTYKAHRALLPGQSLVKEYAYGDISSFPATGTIDPSVHSEAYGPFLKNGFGDWRLSVEGRVARPGMYSLADLQKFPMRKQITRHLCEEGWSAIAEWTGVPLSLVLQHAGILPTARFVNFVAYDGYRESIDLLDAFHPQTLLAYGMNGRDLSIPHGAPVRARVETQVGYKSIKFIESVVVSDDFIDNGDIGWAWYVGI
ncbi:MAG TPA: molybdopterin-dependent oxidoreductase [Chryseolinea sp.]